MSFQLLRVIYIYIYIYICIYVIYIYICMVNVALTSARCETVSHTPMIFRPTSWRLMRRANNMIFRHVRKTVGFDIEEGAIAVGGLTWRQVDTSNLRFNCVYGFAWLSNISTFSSRHK